MTEPLNLLSKKCQLQRQKLKNHGILKLERTKYSSPTWSFKGKHTEKLEKLDDLPKIIQLIRHKDWTRTQTS